MCVAACGSSDLWNVHSFVAENLPPPLRKLSLWSGSSQGFLLSPCWLLKVSCSLGSLYSCQFGAGRKPSKKITFVHNLMHQDVWTDLDNWQRMGYDPEK